MEFTAQQIADVVGGQIEGNAQARVRSLAKIEEGKEGDLSFLSNPKYTHFIYKTKASVVLVNEDLKPDHSVQATLVRVENAYVAFGKLLRFYNDARKPKPLISTKASLEEDIKIGDKVSIGDFTVIQSGAVLGDNVCIYPQVFIGSNVKIGNNSVIHPGVKIYQDCIIGDDCIIHSGSVIGADGFGFAPHDGTYDKLPQIGNVVIEDHVEIGANTCIDRATLGSTVICKGAKLDNLIQTGHNAIIGANTVIAAQSGISGSSVIGSNVMMGGQVGIVGHLKVGNGAMIAAQSGVSTNIPDGQVVMGSPAMEIKRYKKAYVIFRNLARLLKRVDDLEAKEKTE